MLRTGRKDAEPSVRCQESGRKLRFGNGILSYAMFGQVAEKFFEKRKDKQLGIDAEHADKANKVMPV